MINSPIIPISNDSLLEVLSLTKNAVAVYNSEDLHIRFASESMLAMWGKDRGVIGQTLEEAVPDLSGQSFGGLLREVWRSGEPYIAQNIPANLTIAGKLQTFFFDVECLAIGNSRDGTECILHTSTDVTARYAASQEGADHEKVIADSNEELQQLIEELTASNEEILAGQESLSTAYEALVIAEEKSKVLLETAPVAIGVINMNDLTVELANKRLQELWNQPDSPLTGKSLRSILPDGYYNELKTILATVQASRTSVFGSDIEVLQRGAQMGGHFFNFVYQPVKDSSGNVHSVIIIANDVTQQRNEKIDADAALLQSLLARQAADLGMFDLDVVNDLLTWDRRCRQLFGIEGDKPVSYSRDFINGLHPEDRDRVIAAVNRAYRKSESNGLYDIEYRTLSADGQTMHWIKAVGQVHFNAEEEPVRFIGMVMDITETVAARENLQTLNHTLIDRNEAFRLSLDQLQTANAALKTSNANVNSLNELLVESETHFRRLVEQAPVAIMVLRGEDLLIEIANGPMLAILHRDDSIVGRPILEGMPELRGEPAVELLFEVFRTGKESNGSEVPVRMLTNGESKTRYFNFSYRALLDGGKIIGVMDIAVEVTDQVEARIKIESILEDKVVLEKSLRANEQRLQGILDTMAEGVGITDASGKMIYANAMAQKILGIPESEIRQRTFDDERWQNLRLDGSPLPPDEHPMAMMMKTGVPIYDQEIAIQPSVGERIYISINAAPLFDDDGRLSGGIGTFMDVTKRRKIMMVKDDFISIASHELKTPVTSLKASLQLLTSMHHRGKPETVEKLIAQSNKSLNRLTNMIDQLLNANRINQGQLQIYKEPFTVSELIDECCDHLRLQGGYEIVTEGTTDFTILADEHQLNQVLVNLINNAQKYAPESRRIVVRVDKINDMVKISVTDFGPGIPADRVPHLFDRYYRADHGGSKFSGLGLGLYICAEIIRKHNGEIGVETEPGKGSTFWFAIPAEG
ncbi:PAS domain-containing protein [Pedobacter sp. SYP-B3415]|uniref:PAS domain-containing protein n=1 Tax=Pedobacter sp. SYP-B3415 TaxID=2496641 RepID=UPI00101D52AC|nr:PAS domain-containing protein [Pedobacter sp. SYP-B3415]